MTTQKSLKRRVRTRMEKTGESYTTARDQLLTAPVKAGVKGKRVSDEAVRESTGRGWGEWFALLDRWDATKRPHTEVAAWLVAEHGVDGWWAQSVTVAYEQARGLRVPGEQADGTFSVGASRTVGVSVDRLYAAFMDEDLRSQWLLEGVLRARTSQPGRTARFDWDDGSTRVNVGFTAKSDSKSVVAVAHERLADADAAGAMKEHWRERLTALKELLET